jgi:hypothetical protein
MHIHILTHTYTHTFQLLENVWETIDADAESSPEKVHISCSYIDMYRGIDTNTHANHTCQQQLGL